MINAAAWYDVVRTWFAIIPPAVAPFTYFIDAPFGRFSPAADSIFTVDAIKSWILMELVSPLTLLYTFYHSPLSYIPNFHPHLTIRQPTTLLTLFFVLHYLNRAIISPLRTPSRNKFHISVPLSAVLFNIVNGFLMGTYLSSPAARYFLAGAFGRLSFWIGMGVAVVGLAGNIAHDEILFDIRRNAKAKGKAKNDSPPPPKTSQPKEHYAIPHGLLYTYISYPNYFCEWLEWFGFALAAAPFPTFASGHLVLVATLTPPWLFFLSEVFLMLPRALKGHMWYKEKFTDYPRERRAVVPWLI